MTVKPVYIPIILVPVSSDTIESHNSNDFSKSNIFFHTLFTITHIPSTFLLSTINSNLWYSE